MGEGRTLLREGRMSFRREHKLKIEAIRRRLVQEYCPAEIILFGSQARGEADEFSDVDLLVILGGAVDEGRAGRDMEQALSPVRIEKHIFVKTAEHFAQERDLPGTLSFSAFKEGRVLYRNQDPVRSVGPLAPYETRKAEFLDREYGQRAEEYLERAKTSLESGHLFRCRDYMKFGALRALKGIFVKHGLHPPLEQDLCLLLEKACELEPDLTAWIRPVGLLNQYVPVPGEPSSQQAASEILSRMEHFVAVLKGRF